MLSSVGSKAQHSPRYRKVPRLLRELREEAELTQRALGDLLGKPHSWVYNCESGNRRVDVAEFIDWCEACGLNAADVIDEITGGGKGR